MTFVVIATWVAKDSRADDVAEVISNLAPLSRLEPGCVVYRPVQATDDPHVFVIYEEYVDQRAYEDHAASKHFQHFAVGLGFPLLESRTRVFGEPLD